MPDDKNQAKKALREGKVDVLTLSPMHQPDDGIEKFATLALEHNPNVRVTIQEFWIPWDKFEWPFKGKPDAVDFDAAKIAELRKMHAPYFKTFDDYVRALNKKLGKQVVFVVPSGQAVLALREKIVAGQAPGLPKQSDLFSDKLGHPQPPLQALGGLLPIRRHLSHESRRLAAARHPGPRAQAPVERQTESLAARAGLGRRNAPPAQRGEERGDACTRR